ncbi:hypothetical protein EDB92DRAFT_2104805 [Lactarius akahatsu]|uniref:Uncharacterized protein n=1 Tax=Lactarius akahatsu TaxID=416441 RepID=A0AAD4LBW2_9AGAM|nr:hypothetical protein EDB92DRAFT_2104805 [Lactarius akahatsu]
MQINNLAFTSPNLHPLLLPAPSPPMPQTPLPSLLLTRLASPSFATSLAMPTVPHTSPPPLPLALSSFALPDKRPPLPAIIDLCNDDDDDAYPLSDIIDLYADDDGDTLASPIAAPPASARIVDNTTPFEGVKTLNISVSTPPINPPRPINTQYPALFLSHGCERPRDPDEVGPTVPHHHVPTPHLDSPATRIAIVSAKRPLHTPAREKRAREYDGDDEGPHKQIRNTPLPKFNKYRPRTQRDTPKENKPRPSPYLKPGEKPKTTDSAKPPTFDGALQHVLYRYRSEAKDPEYPLNPFDIDLWSIVHGN